MTKSRIFFYLFLISISVFVVCSDIRTTYAGLGNFCLKYISKEKALNFYEKAFDAGYSNLPERKIYVDLLINSPHDIETQDKLIKIAEDKNNDSASRKAAIFLNGLRHKIHKDYPNNYIQQASYNKKIIRWSRFPVTYTFKNPDTIPAEYVSEIRNAFQEWEKTGIVTFSEIREGSADIIIEFQIPKIEETEYGQKYVSAYTIPNIINGRLKSFEIKFYEHNPEKTPYTPVQIYNTALHEIFHALGFMGHSLDKKNIMYSTKDKTDIVNNTRLKPASADINTLTLLYKIKPDITNTVKSRGEYASYLALGDEDDVYYARIREAKNYIRQAPYLPEGYIDYAECLASQDDYAGAVKSLEKALRLADTSDITYIVCYNLAVSYFYIGHAEMALHYAQKAQNIKDTEEIHLLFAEIYVLQKNTEKAAEEYDYLTKISPDNADYAIYLTNIYIKKHDYLKARKVLKTFLKNNPQKKNEPMFSAYGILRY